MKSVFYRDTWAEINLDAIRENVIAMRSFLHEDTKLCAVVKANGYGHGDIEVASAALEAGADFLAVAFLDEALVLREKGIEVPILVLGAIRSQDAALAARYNISVTVFRKDWLMEASNFLAEGDRLTIHIKCDTGMGRLGFRNEEELKDAEDFIKGNNSFLLEGIYTHFATADELEYSYVEKQLKAFEKMLQTLTIKPPLIHSSNSAASMRYNASWFNAVRMGISMYGLSPSVEMKGEIPFPLQEAFSLHTKIVNVKKVAAGESISYGATYTTQEEEWIATLPIGYADGWIRKLQGQDVLINGERMPIVGRICMDQCMVRLTKHYPVGTPVVLIGKSGENTVTADEIAEKLETINYEVVCMISNRVPRVFVKNGNVQSVRNAIL